MNKCAGTLFALAALAVAGRAQAIVECAPCSAPAGVVSVRALLYKPPHTARKEFDRGMHSLRKRLRAEAMVHFTEATRISPDFVEAHFELGLLHAEDGEQALALESFLRALALEPESTPVQFDVALTLAKLHRPAEAEPYVRRVVRSAPWFVEARYLLAMTLIVQNEITPEATASLRLAADKYPGAREALTRVETERTPGVSGN